MKKNYVVVFAVVVIVVAGFFAVTPAHAMTAEQQQLATLSAYFDALKNLFQMLSAQFSPSTAQAQDCSSTAISLLGTGCHDMFTGYWFNSAMDQYVPYGGSTVNYCTTTWVSGCSTSSSSTSTTSTTCPSNIATLLGSGCHDMYSGYYFNTSMDQYVPYGGSAVSYCSTTWVSGCTSSGGSGCGSYYSQSSCTAVSGCSWNSTGNYCYYSTSGGTVPSAPSLNTPSTSGTSVSLSWVLPSGSTATWYQVSRRTPSGSTNAWSFPSGGSYVSGASFTDSSVTSGSSYDYRVVACNSYGCSADSNIGSVTVGGGSTSTSTTSGAPPVPATPTGSASVAVNAYTGYNSILYPDPNNDQMIAVFDWGDGTTSSTEGWTPGTAYVVRYHAWATAGTYYVKVKARDYTGLESGWSGTLAVTVTTSGGTTSSSTAPSSPSNLSGYPSGSSASLSWQDNSTNESGFEVYKMVNGTWSQLGYLGPNITTYTDTNFNQGLPAGTYTYYVNSYIYSGGTYLRSSASNNTSVTIGGGGSSTSTTTNAPIVDLKADGVDGTLTRTAPAYYGLTWTTTGNPTTCVPGGTWSTSGDKTASGGSWAFNAVTVLGLKTYSLTCSNAYGSNTDTVYVDVTSGSTSSSTTTVDSSLIGYWKFDGNGNNEVAGKPAAVAVGSPSYYTSGGKIGGYGYIPSQSNYFKVAHDAAYNLPDSFTIEFWFRQRADRSFRQDLISKGIRGYYPSATVNFWVWRQLWDQYNFGPIQASYVNANTSYFVGVTNTNQLSHGQWHHVAYTKDTTGSAYFLDGASIYRTTDAAPAKTNSSDILIGDTAQDTDIDNLKIYNRALTASEVAAAAGGSSGGGGSTPVAPSSLRQTGATSGYIALSWYDNSNNEDKFNLERKPSNGTTWALITQTGPNIIAYADSSITSGTSYDYRTQACLSGVGCSAYTYVYGVSSYISGTSTSTTSTTCPSNIASLLGSGCHDMYTGAYFNSNMDQYVLYGGSAVNYCGTAWVSGCSTGTGYSTSTTSTSCPSNIATLLGSGCHWMTNAYFNGAMTQYAYSGSSSVYSCTTTWISGCTTGTGYSTSTTSTTCPSNIATLLGSGCHDMYTGAYFNGEMTQYVPYGGSAVSYCSTTWVSGCSGSSGSSGCGSYYSQSSCTGVSGCSWNSTGNYCYYASSGGGSCPAGQYWYVPPSGGAGYCTTSTTNVTSTATGQREQLWNSFGLRSWVRTDADPTRIAQLAAACVNVPSNSSVYIWMPNAGNFSSVDFGMPDPLKCQQAAMSVSTQTTCPAGQYWYVPPAGGAGYCTYTSSQAPTVDIKVDGSDTKVYRTAPASYSLSWNTTGNPTSCVPSGTWGVSGGSKSIPSGSQSFALVTVTGPKTYTLTCSNAYGSATDTVTVEVTGETVISTSTPPVGLQGGFVQGFVTDGSGRAITGAYVHVFTENFGLNFSSITGANGSFGLNVPAGTYLIEVSPPSVRTDLARRAPQKFLVGNGEVRTLSLQFEAPSKTIVGSVAFSTGEAITDAEVGAYSSVTNQWTKAFTDGSGKFSLRVSGGTWQVGIRPRDPLSAKWAWAGDIQQVVFSSASGEETRTVNFVIFVSDAKLVVHAVDQAGNVVQGAGIVVDSIGAGQKPIGVNLPPPVFRKADASGSADFFLKGGTYYVRAFLPSEFGYFNPDEQQVILAGQQTKDVSLVFRKYETVVNRLSLTGTAKLDDGTPTAAFIWAWSENGYTAETRSLENGSFTFQVVAGRWHVGAGKEVGGFPYKSGELTVDVGIATPSVEIVLAKVGSVRLPPPVEVSQSATQQIVAQATDGAKVTVPEGAAQTSGTVNVEVKPTIEAPSQAAAKVVSTVYDVNITGETGNKVTSLTKDIEITIPYNEADLAKQGVTEDTFVPSYYDETTGTWVKVDNYTIDKEKNVVIVRVNHLTRFALVAAADITPPVAPGNTAAKTGQPGEVTVSWTNPTSDFSHVKIYRSAIAGELGKIVANNVTGKSVSDTDVVSGVKYYYTVRAVDPAGNESVNTTQVSVTASGVYAGPKLSPGQVTKAAILRTLQAGSSGDDVTALQELLIKEGVYPDGLVTGYFGNLTKQAVIRFQEKYASEILTPNGLTSGNGFVGPSTRAKMNVLLGTAGSAAAPALVQDLPPGQVTKAAILRTLQAGSSGDDVTALQELLIKEGVYPDGLVTGYFGNLTKQAVIRFQEKYASEILTPNGLTSGTGTVGPSTRAKINQLLK